MTEGKALEFLSPQSFVKALHLEQKRAERSRRLLALLMVECGSVVRTLSGNHKGRETEVRNRVSGAIAAASRETDVKGWYRQNEVVGVIFTEIPAEEASSIVQVLSGKMKEALTEEFGAELVDQAVLSFYLYPEDWHKGSDEGPSLIDRYPDLVRNPVTGPARHVKRALDIVGSLMAILLLSPLFLIIALAVKLTSRGPVIFRQERLGYGSRPFTFLKFRSMYTNSDESIHQEFVSKLISGEAEAPERASQPSADFKIKNDPRVTPLGRFLRKSSLDELPQFFNVLSGEMSLVGPRPPVAYEVDRYDVWHRHRLLAAKPGMTGLWQVEGRSRVRFDEMVRLDLRYASNWSIWLDLKILLQTPLAVIGGSGAR